VLLKYENRESVNQEEIHKELKEEPRGRNHGNGDQIHRKQFSAMKEIEHVFWQVERGCREKIFTKK